jgi:hypothetical protein
MKKQISKKDLASYIQEQVQNLYKLHTLNEEKTKIENDLKVLSENKYTKKASNFIGKEISHLQKDKGYKHDRAVAAALNVAKDKGYKVPAPTNEIDKSAMDIAKKDIKNDGQRFDPLGKNSFEDGINKKSLYKAMSPEKKLNEGLTEKGIATLQKWIAEKGARGAGVKMIDQMLNNIIGLSSSDLPDSATFANGLDDIESLLESGNYDGALEVARDTAKEMVEEEGGGDMFGESKKLNEGMPAMSRDELMAVLKQKFPKAWFKPGEDFGSDYSENSIWTGEGSYANNGMELFNDYAEGEGYEMGVYKPLNDLVESLGYYFEPYDSGTFFIIPG